MNGRRCLAQQRAHKTSIVARVEESSNLLLEVRSPTRARFSCERDKIGGSNKRKEFSKLG